MLVGERGQGKMAGTLDGNGQLALMLGARSGFAACPNAAIIVYITAKGTDIFPINSFHLVHAKAAYFTTRSKT